MASTPPLQYACSSAYVCAYFKKPNGIFNVLVAQKGYQQTRDAGLVGVRQFIVNNPGQHVFSGGGIKDARGQRTQTVDQKLAIEAAFTEFKEEAGINFDSVKFSGGTGNPPTAIKGTVRLYYSEHMVGSFDFTAKAFQDGFLCVFINMETSENILDLCAFAVSNFPDAVSDELADMAVLPLVALRDVSRNVDGLPVMTNLNRFIDPYDPTLSTTPMLTRARAFVDPLGTPYRPDPNTLGNSWGCNLFNSDNLITARFALFCYTNNVCAICVPFAVPMPINGTTYNQRMQNMTANMGNVITLLDTCLTQAAAFTGTLYNSAYMEYQVKFAFKCALVSVAQVVWVNQPAIANAATKTATTKDIMTMLGNACLAVRPLGDNARAVVTETFTAIRNDIATLAPNTGARTFAAPPSPTFNFTDQHFSNDWFSAMATHCSTL